MERDRGPGTPDSGTASAADQLVRSEPVSPGRRLAEYEALLRIGVELTSTLDPLRVMELALRQAEEFCQAETSSIWEVDDARRELFFRIVRGWAAGQIRDLKIPMGEGIVGSVAVSGKSEVVNDVVADPRWRGDVVPGFRTRSILTVPLLAHGRVVGVLQLLNPIGRGGFTADDLERMELFAAPLAHALDNARLHAAQKRQFVETVTALAEAVEKRDPYTGGHVHRVVGYSLLLGTELELAREELERLRLAATLHDIGKIAIPDHILQKPGALDLEERRAMDRHTIDGAEIVDRVGGLRELLPGIRSHHERIDGRGYPDGLRDRDIPLVARIIAVADTYDAMTTSRPYRAALAPTKAAAEIQRGAGTQFCPRVVAAFGALFERGEFGLEAGDRLLASLSAEEESA